MKLHLVFAVALFQASSSFCQAKEENSAFLRKVQSLPGRRLPALSWVPVLNDIDGEFALDESGAAIDINCDGSMVVIGAVGNDQSGPDSGHARVFKVKNGVWTQVGLDIDGLVPLDGAGIDVAMSYNGKTIAVGSKFNGFGSVRVFEFITFPGAWVQKGGIIIGLPDEHAGFSVDISGSGSVVVLGAPGSDANGVNSGLVRAFKYEAAAGDWVQLGTDMIGDASSDGSGYSVATTQDGTVVAVGASFHSGGVGGDLLWSGQVKVYEFNGVDWFQKGLDIDGQSILDRSGFSVDLSCDGLIVAIGAVLDNNSRGSAIVYKWDAGAWVQMGPLIDGDFAGDQAGHSVSLSGLGTVLAVGAPYHGAGGHAKVFKYDAGTDDWVQLGDDIEGENSDDASGFEVALSNFGSTVAVGAPYNDGSALNAGHVRVLALDPPQNFPSGCKGDPHFKTWKGEHFEYHGQCDMILTKDESFANGLGMELQIRTKLVRYWSYIKSTAIRIGDDILEIEGSADDVEGENHYWFNFEYRADFETIGGFPVKYYHKSKGQNKEWSDDKYPGQKIARRFEIDLSSKYPGEKIVISSFKEFVRVDFENTGMEAFGNVVGMLGDFMTGQTLARDGVTELNDFSMLGNEWQVLPHENMLFHDTAKPQFPEKCIEPEDPLGERRRRLGESTISEKEAEAACGSLADPLDRKDCIYDVLATQDMGMVGAY